MNAVIIKTSRRLVLSASLFLFVSPTTFVHAASESNAAANIDVDEEIVITATRTARPWLQTPASVERVAVDEQLPGQRTDAAELLAGISGVQVDTRYNFAQDTRITIRGFGARAAFGVRGVRMRLDGIPLSMPDGQGQTSSILLEEPYRVEVLRGPFAAIYGNASGGVIDFQSERPLTSEALVSISSGTASRNKEHLRAVYAQTDHSVSFDYVDFSTAGDRPHSRAQRTQYALRWYWDLSPNWQSIVRIDDNQAPDVQDPSALTPDAWRENPNQVAAPVTLFNTRKTTTHRQQSVTLRGQFANGHSTSVSVWNGARDIEQYLGFPGSAITASGGVVDLQRDFSGLALLYRATPLASIPWQITTALDMERQTDVRQGFINDQGVRGDLRRDETGRVESIDLSVMSDWQISQDWSLIGGVRRSDLDFSVVDRFIVPPSGDSPGNPDDSGGNRFQEHSWSLGLNYAITPSVSLFASLGEGFETPTLTEMAYRNEGSGLNTELQASHVQQFDFGAKGLTSRARWQASVFAIESTNDLVVDQSIDGRTTFRNAAETRRTGIEFSNALTLNAYWSLRTSYTYMRAEFSGDTEERGNRLPGLATQQLFNQLEFRPDGTEHWRMRLQQSYRSRIAIDDDNSGFAPAATLWSFASEWQYRSGELPRWQVAPWFRIDNITDKRYVGSVVVNQGNGRAFEPAPGRVWMLGFTMRYQ